MRSIFDLAQMARIVCRGEYTSSSPNMRAKEPVMQPFTHRSTHDQLMTDLKAVIASAEDLLTATANQSGAAIESARAKAESSIEQARKKVVELEEAVLDRAKEIVANGEHRIKENPWSAVGISAGVGLLLGLLIGRR
jgi:ElaB/YqjD/DUF883 family membrane-anchored ribosome-binding protein